MAFEKGGLGLDRRCATIIAQSDAQTGRRNLGLANIVMRQFALRRIDINLQRVDAQIDRRTFRHGGEFSHTRFTKGGREQRIEPGRIITQHVGGRVGECVLVQRRNFFGTQRLRCKAFARTQSGNTVAREMARALQHAEHQSAACFSSHDESGRRFHTQ